MVNGSELNCKEFIGRPCSDLTGYYRKTLEDINGITLATGKDSHSEFTFRERPGVFQLYYTNTPSLETSSHAV